MQSAAQIYVGTLILKSIKKTVPNGRAHHANEGAPQKSRSAERRQNDESAGEGERVHHESPGHLRCSRLGSW